jgi:hypothetical protein
MHTHVFFRRVGDESQSGAYLASESRSSLNDDQTSVSPTCGKISLKWARSSFNILTTNTTQHSSRKQVPIRTNRYWARERKQFLTNRNLLEALRTCKLQKHWRLDKLVHQQQIQLGSCELPIKAVYDKATGWNILYSYHILEVKTAG